MEILIDLYKNLYFIARIVSKALYQLYIKQLGIIITSYAVYI